MKNKKKQLAGNILLTLVIGMYHSVPAFALPSQGTLDNSNAAAISTQGATMSITGKGANNILNWATFSIDKGETVKFTDKSNYLNLVRGVDISRIYGTLSGGGTVYLVNPNGILFGQGAKLDNVGSFIASTRNISAINQDAFLSNPNDTTAVLGTDSKEMDNKDYYPADSSYVPKISVADIQLTNVPQSATKIILDGPGGVILKNTELLDKTTQVLTRKDGGEIGIGSDTGNVALTDAQKAKIGLIEGNVAYNFNENPNVLQGYKTVSNTDELRNMDVGTDLRFSSLHEELAKKYILVNDIDASDIINFRPINGVGIFEGLGYEISGLKIKTSNNVSDNDVWHEYGGFFNRFNGDVRNLNLDVSIKSNGWPAGGLAGSFYGNISNVNITGTIESNKNMGGIVGEGGSYFTGSKMTEIRNSSNQARLSSSLYYNYNMKQNVGGIAGIWSGNIVNVFNTAEISSYSSNFEDDKNDNIRVGGIVGELENDTVQSMVVGAYNKGNRIISAGFAGGIIGYTKNARIGETYNLGFTAGDNWIYGNDEPVIVKKGIVGNDNETNTVKKSVATNKMLDSYYLKAEHSENMGDIVGIALEKENMDEVFKPEMFGVYDNSAKGRSVGTPINVEKPDVPSVMPGGNTGGNDTGSTSGNTGGNDSGSTGTGTVVPKPDVPSVMPGGNTDGNNTGSTGSNTGTQTNDSPSWHFEYKDTTLDTEWQLIENGVIPQGYEGEILVVRDPNYPERDKVYIHKDPVVTVITDGMTVGLVNSRKTAAQALNTTTKLDADWARVTNDLFNKVTRLIEDSILPEKTAKSDSESLNQIKQYVTITRTNQGNNIIENNDAIKTKIVSSVMEGLKTQIDSSSPDYSYNDLFGDNKNKGLNKFLGKIMNGFKDIDFNDVTIGNTTYKLKGDLTWSSHKIADAIITIKTDSVNPATYTLVFTNVGTDLEEAMAKYCFDLAKLNKTAWEKAAEELVISPLKTELGTANHLPELRATKFGKDLINAISNDALADSFLNHAGSSTQKLIQDEAKKGSSEILRKSIENLSGGKTLVNAIDNYKKAEKQYKAFKEALETGDYPKAMYEEYVTLRDNMRL